jgi:hypothetical protein
MTNEFIGNGIGPRDNATEELATRVEEARQARALVETDMTELEAQALTTINEDSNYMFVTSPQIPEPLPPLARRHKMQTSQRLLAALAMIGGLPPGFPDEPTTHDKITAKVHDQQGALDRAEAKRERKLQRNVRASK